MERLLRNMEVWGQRNYSPESELIANRYSKLRPARLLQTENRGSI